ncbi:MAG: O-antigen ligase family protein [Betaproteobacteria bacterium]
MPSLEFRRSVWHIAALCILLAYPIMGSKWFPFGGGPRYLSVLAAPVCLLLIFRASRSELQPLWRETWRWCLPFLPFVAGWMFVQLWHQYTPVDAAPLSRLLWCALIFVGARLAGVNYRHLAIAAGVAAAAYGAMAFWEVFVQGRERAWGRVYENRFGQYAIWVAALCVLHAVLGKPEDRSQKKLAVGLIFGSLLGLFAAILSGSRGALMALPVLMLMLIFKIMDWRRGILVVTGMIAVMGALCYFYSPIYSRFELIYTEIFNYFHDPSFTPTSIGVRLELARVSLVTWFEHPWLGAGYTSLKQLYETHPALGVPPAGVLGIPGFHSDWFQVLGTGGGVLFSCFFATCVWMCAAARRDAYRLSFLGFALAFSFAEIFFTNNLGLSLLMACWALYAAAERNRKSPQ